jgi:hypothetical protein
LQENERGKRGKIKPGLFDYALPWPADFALA